ncbi:MAG: DUF1684 domain-containing protein [Cytophagia bacterium]|nr:MAG: DUF1684 domain-containing protein [Cytophagia bacterium]TAH30647.1 MAG: DUF1684 domain-containing protein [Cytophagales bacterium]
MKIKIVLLFVFWQLLIPIFAQKNNIYQKDIAKKFQEELNASYKNKKTSPLSAKDLASFKKHSFFKINSKYCVEATVINSTDEKPFPMPTTAGTKTMYIKYGVANFEIDNKKYALNIYQSIDLSKKPGYEDYLFMPFRDLTNGKTTYEGGRFMDFRISKDNKIIIDFNKAYNPYCAYSDNYACPIIPKENSLEVEILAGIKFKNK